MKPEEGNKNFYLKPYTLKKVSTDNPSMELLASCKKDSNFGK